MSGVDVSAIIPTMSRPTDLALTVASLMAQTALPGEVIVVDAGADDDTARLVENFRLAFRGADFIYERAAPGLPGQRNAGLARARGDVVLFLDDDVTLAPDFLAALLGAMEDGAVGGACGVIVNQRLPGRYTRFLQWLFRQPRYARRSFLQRSGLPTFLYRPAAPAAVKILTGCDMAFRRAALGGFRFDARLNYFDDDDVSLTAARRGMLLQVPAARVEHRLAPAARPEATAKVRRRVLEQRLLHRRHVPQNTWNVLCYYYSVFGAAAMAALRLRPRLAWGTLLGLGDVLRTGGGRRLDAAREGKFIPRPEE